MTDDVRGRAVQLCIQTWELIDQARRAPDDDRQMLTFTMAGRAQWGGGDGAQRREASTCEDLALIEGQLATVHGT